MGVQINIENKHSGINKVNFIIFFLFQLIQLKKNIQHSKFGISDDPIIRTLENFDSPTTIFLKS
jgi:hypothetical protein